ncbi:MAG: RHS repeat protein [Sulfuricella sp.]|nr:RHS repeat protein [Sulfuricella sp.]
MSHIVRFFAEFLFLTLSIAAYAGECEKVIDPTYGIFAYCPTGFHAYAFGNSFSEVEAECRSAAETDWLLKFNTKRELIPLSDPALGGWVIYDVYDDGVHMDGQTHETNLCWPNGSYGCIKTMMYQHYFCPDGYKKSMTEEKCYLESGTTGACGNPDINAGEPDYCTVGNPVNHGNGHKLQKIVDYKSTINEFFDISRFYLHTKHQSPGVLGSFWRLGIEHKIVIPSFDSRGEIQDLKNPVSLFIYQPNGNKTRFDLNHDNGAFSAKHDPSLIVYRVLDNKNTPIGWEYVDTNDVTFGFGVDGSLLYISPIGTSRLTIERNENGAPKRLFDSVGNELGFEYGKGRQLIAVKLPDGKYVKYFYDPTDWTKLVTVQYPSDDGEGDKVVYRYDDVNQTSLLSGIIDENGNEYGTYLYYADGKISDSVHTNGLGNIHLAYGPDGHTFVTDSHGATKEYGFTTINGVLKLSSVSQPAGPHCPAAAKEMKYDDHGNMVLKDDFNGNRSRYWYDHPRNLEIIRVEGLVVENGVERVTPETRTIKTKWHTTLRKPAFEYFHTGDASENGDPVGIQVKSIKYVYGDEGNLTAYTETDVVRNVSRTWKYTWLSRGRIKSIDGPRTDVADISSFSYYAAVFNLSVDSST